MNKVLIVSTQELQPGAKLAVGVMHPRQRDQELLKAGFVFDADVITRLLDMGVPSVFIDFPGLSDLDALLLPILSPERRAVYDRIKKAMAASEQANRPVARYGDYRDTTREWIKSILLEPRSAMMLDVLSRGPNDPEGEVEHATTVAHLALVLGMRLESHFIRERPRLSPTHAKELTGLGVAAMLHDIGKTKLPEHLRSHHALQPPEREQDFADWQSHTVLGFELVRGDVDACVSATILHHHQRFDGGGFPGRAATKEGRVATPPLAGRSIHVFARVLQAADLFERLAHRPDGKRRTNYEALHLLRRDHAGRIDPEVLATMPSVIPPFGPGRRVTLSDGAAAIVTGFHAQAPYTPVVKRFDAAAQKAAEESIDLRARPDLRITHIEGEPLEAFERAPERAA